VCVFDTLVILVSCFFFFQVLSYLSLFYDLSLDFLFFFILFISGDDFTFFSFLLINKLYMYISK